MGKNVTATGVKLLYCGTLIINRHIKNLIQSKGLFPP